MPDEDYRRPEDFNLDGGWEQGNDPSLADIADAYGWSSWRDVIAPDGGFDEQDVRPGAYHSIEDAIQEAYNVGILEWSTFLYDYEEDEWYIIVDY